MQLSEVGIRIDYFHDSSDDHLRTLGVDPTLLPSREEWLSFYQEDYARPISARMSYSLLWLSDGDVVGFSSTDRIDFGQQISCICTSSSRNFERRVTVRSS
ncbi:MAG: hypothetical protein WA614_09505 [Acidimicrobiales bacterium]|jgi:hypothetical protein